MGDWRHFGECLERATVSPECYVGPDLHVPPAAVPPANGLPLRDPLNRIIEGEILPRLMLAHRHPATPTRLPVERRPSPEEIARFSELLLLPSVDGAMPHVLALLDEGLSLESLLLDLLAPAARHLGRLWEEDECDFVDVTVAIGRLQAIARELCVRLEDEAVPDNGRSILLIPCPGETHTFGLSLIASFFREAGWHVTTVGADPGVDPLGLLRDEWFDVIGLSLSCEVFLPAMIEAVRNFRRASRNAQVRVIAGGPLFLARHDVGQLVGADAVAPDGRVALTLAESLLEKRARAC